MSLLSKVCVALLSVDIFSVHLPTTPFIFVAEMLFCFSSASTGL
jgi:uncharacterized membrane protein YbaN (DUF454 family)